MRLIRWVVGVVMFLALLLSSTSHVSAPKASTPESIPVPNAEDPPSKPKAKDNPRWSKGIATAYYNAKDAMNGLTGVTASGHDLDHGITYKGYRVLSAGKKFPLGTLIDIRLSSGEIISGIVLDRGRAIKGNHFDIVFSSYQECKEFGRQNIEWTIKGRE